MTTFDPDASRDKIWELEDEVQRLEAENNFLRAELLGLKEELNAPPIWHAWWCANMRGL